MCEGKVREEIPEKMSSNAASASVESNERLFRRRKFAEASFGMLPGKYS
jgi:hypothetical protein